MKKIVIVLLSALLMISLAACGSGNSDQGNESSSQNSEADTEEQDSSDGDAETDDQDENEGDIEADVSEGEEDTDISTEGNKPLVIYFSRTGEQYGVGVIDKGNTEIVAEMIVEETGADSYEVLPADDYYPYTYKELTDVALEEQNQNARPAYTGDVPDLSKYDTIYIGAPVWWGDWPMLMYTFFEANEEALSGKTLIPFCTHAGSGLSGFDTKLQSTITDATVLSGLAISGSDTQNNPDSVKNAVQDWIADLGL